MKYYLYSSKNIFLQKGNEIIELPPGKILEIEKNSIVNILSTNSEFLPFCFKTDLQNVFKSPCLKTVEYPDSLMIEVVPMQVFRPVFLKGRNFKEYAICLIGKPFNLLVDNEEQHYVFKCGDNLKNVVFSERNSYLIMQAEQNELDYVVIFHKNSKTFYEFVGVFSLDNNIITLIKDKKTFARHGELLKFEISEKDISLTMSDPIYLNVKPSRIAPFLNVIAFFQAVKEKDYFLAKSYLSQSFALRLSPEHFEEFFGEFDEIKPIKYLGQRKIALLQKVSSNHSIARIFEVVSENDSIKDIIEN